MTRRRTLIAAAALTVVALAATGGAVIFGLRPSSDSSVSSGRSAQQVGNGATSGQLSITQRSSPGVDDSLKRDIEKEVDVDKLRNLLSPDFIRPIYDPRFSPGKLTSLRPGEAVIGVEINGESRAYPILILGGREKVNDVVGGVPILVTR